MHKVELVYCAGGLLWRQSDRGLEILLILSRDDQFWKFPKGHIDPTDAGWDAAAQREVKEETGYSSVIINFAGFTQYPIQSRSQIVSKVVFYWHMEPVGEWQFEPSEEIERCEWLTVKEAVNRLTFSNDKQFLLRFTNDDGYRNE